MDSSIHFPPLNPLTPTDFEQSFQFQTNFFQASYNNLYLAYQNLLKENHFLKLQLKMQHLNNMNHIPQNIIPFHEDNNNCKQEPLEPLYESPQKFDNQVKRNFQEFNENKIEFSDTTQEETSYETPQSSVKLEENLSDEDYEPMQKKVFSNKRKATVKNSKVTEIQETDPKEKNKKISKAKHLWDTYGRKITKYALKHTHGELREKIERCEPLISKQAFINVFAIQWDAHSEVNKKKEAEFKKEYARLALKFIDSETKTTFLNLKYQNNLLTLKDEVKELIERLTGSHDLNE